MASPTISALQEELMDLVKSVPSFKGRGFTIFDLEDLMRLSELQEFPLVGVSYNGSMPVGHKVDAVNITAPSAVQIDHQFVIVVAVQYQYAGQQDNKSIATDLLDEIRNVVLGFRGVNVRPWRWMGDHPEPAASIDGIILYSQVWHTATTAVGNFNS